MKKKKLHYLKIKILNLEAEKNTLRTEKTVLRELIEMSEENQKADSER